MMKLIAINPDNVMFMATIRVNPRSQYYILWERSSIMIYLTSVIQGFVETGDAEQIQGMREYSIALGLGQAVQIGVWQENAHQLVAFDQSSHVARADGEEERASE